MVQIYYKSTAADTWHALECYSASVSLNLQAQPPAITASVPKKYGNTAFYALKAGDYIAEVSDVKKDVSRVTISASKAEALQETRIDISALPAGYSAIILLEIIAQNLGITLDYDISEVSNLNALICNKGAAVDYAINVINDVCNYFGCYCQVITPSLVRLQAPGAQESANLDNYISCQEIRAESRYFGGVCVNKIAPNASKQTYAYALKKGKDAAELHDPNINILVGEYQQNDGLTAEDYKTYKNEYTLETQADDNYIMSGSISAGLLHSTDMSEARKALFFCAPCTEIITLEKRAIASEMRRTYYDPNAGQNVTYYPTYKSYTEFFMILCAPSWFAGRDIYNNGVLNEPGGNLALYRIFTDQADTQIISATTAAVLEYMPGASLLQGWDVSTLSTYDSAYSDPSVQYPNYIQYPGNKIEDFNMPANDNWPYWPWRRYITAKDETGEASGRIDYDPPGGTKSIENTWEYVKSISFSCSQYDPGFSGITGIQPGEIAPESFFDPRKNATQYKDSFFAGGASNLHGTPGEANMQVLPNIKYQVKKDPSYILIYLQPNKIKAAVSARWNYAGAQPQAFATASQALVISDLAGAASLRGAVITAVSGGNGEATAADVSYTIGAPGDNVLSVTSQFWGTRAACEAALPAFMRIFGDNSDYTTFTAPGCDLAPGDTVTFAGNLHIITDLSYNIGENTQEGKLIAL